MKSCGAWVCFLAYALTISSLGCSNSSKQAVDASPSGDAAIADAGAERAADAPVPGADAAKDTAPAGAPEVATLCPGIDIHGYDSPFAAGSTPFPDGVELLVPSGDPYVMLVTDSELYWANTHTIHRMTLADGVDKVLLDRTSLDNNFNDLAVDATNLYFTEGGLYEPYRVAKMPLDGSSAPVTLGGNISPWYVAVAGEYVYYYDANVVEIDRLPIAGGAVTTLVRNVAPDSFVLANGHIYFTDQVTPTEDALLSIPLDAQASSPADGGTDGGTGGLQKLASNNVGISGPSYDGGYLYYLDGGNLMKMPAGGGTPSAFQTQQGPIPMGPIGVGGGHVYWITGNQTCPNIIRAAMDGSGQTAVVHAIEHPRRFALNATHLFILTGSQQILRVPR
jgi:hypothetical protein